MPATPTCPRCGQDLSAQAGTGRPAVCPACMATVVLPSADPDAAAGSFAFAGAEPSPPPAAAPAPPPSAAAKAPGQAIGFAAPEVKAAPPAVAPVAAAPAPAPKASRPDRKPERKRKKGKKRAADDPILIFMGIPFTPMKLGVTVVALLLLLTGAVFLFRKTFGLNPGATVVDAYTALERVPQLSDLQGGGEDRFSGLPRAPIRMIVTRPYAEGKHLLVTFTIPKKMLDEHFGDKVMISHLMDGDVTLEGGGQTVPGLYLINKLPPQGDAVNFAIGRPREERTTPQLPQVKLGPFDSSPWQHPGELSSKAEDHQVFKGRSGMEVDFALSALPRPTVKVVWDSRSTGWQACARASNPNNVLGAWDVACLFPRIAAPGGLVLKIWGNPYPLDASYAAPPGTEAPPADVKPPEEKPADEKPAEK